MPAAPPGAGATRRRAIDAPIVELAARQHGVVTRGQLVGLGLDRSAIARRAHAGHLQRLHRGVYGVGPFLPDRAPLMAAVLACGPGALLSHRSAAGLWGILGRATQPAAIEVTARGSAERRREGIRIHRALLTDDEGSVLDGLPVTTVARTLIDLAPVVEPRELERAIACAERERLVSADDLASMLVRYAGRRAVRQLRGIMSRVGGPAFTRSEAERRFLQLIRRARLPAPRLNVRIDEYEVDFFWPECDLAVEIDGYRYHGSRVRFESDRQRAARLASLGIQVVALTWRQIVDDELATAVQIGQALARARRAHGPKSTAPGVPRSD